MIRLAHVADVHLGARLSGLPDYPGCPDIDATQAAYDAFDALLTRLIDGRYDAVLLAGDLFDRHETGPRALAAARSALTALHDAGIPVALGWGNHDAESPLPARLRLPPSCWVAPDEAPASCSWPDLGTVVHAQSISAANQSRDLAVNYPASQPDSINIGMLHTSLTGEHSRRPCAPTTSQALVDHGYDYWALGHVHHRMRVRDTIAYPGSTHPARPRELGPRGFLELRCGDTITVTAIDTAPVVRELLTADTEADIEQRFAAYAAPEHPVVWTLAGPAELLGPAREIARSYPGFAVA
ncbi:metallophosphoesterase family protein [Nocardia lasii]|uniref:Exonuclease SbcCD subunit D n=1 Tax=Nocardia lasii TaxID=1616107 RepID=A0ABW1JXZ7_9NOCA